MVWHPIRWSNLCREWVAHAQHEVLTITRTVPLEPWIAPRTEAVAEFRYPTRCLTHKC